MSSASCALKLPAEPSAMPEMSSDEEESFVILGKSLVPDVDLSFKSLEINTHCLLDNNVKHVDLEPKSAENVAQSHVSNSGDFSLVNVQGKLNTLIAENTKLRDTIIRNNKAMEVEHEKFIKWKEEVQKSHQAHKIKFTEARAYILQLKKENERLSSELEKSNEIRELQTNELFELKEIIKKSSNNETVPEIGENRLRELENCIEILRASKDKLIRENALKDEENARKTAQLEDKHEEIMKQLNNLKSKGIFDNLELEKVQKQLMCSQEVITKLQLEKLELEGLKDEHFALLEQVNQYKTDYETEHKMNVELRAEKEQIVSDFLQIQKRNFDLNEEMELIRERGLVSIHKRSGSISGSGGGAFAAPNPENDYYQCPICMFGFTSSQACANHVERCLDLSSALP